MNKKRVLISLISLFLLPAVHALDSPGNFGDFLSSIGKIFHDLISNPYTLFFIIGIFLFVLLYAIIHAATKKVTFLEGKSGKMVAVSIAGMSDLAILYSMRNIPIEQHLANIMGPFGLFAGIAIAAVTFLGLRKLTGAKLALFLTGVVLIILATTLNIPSLILGGAALIIASALWLAKGMGSHASSSGPSFMDRFREERKKIKHIDKKERK